MEQVQQRISAREPAVWQGLRRGAAAGLGGDAFLAIFQHMMEGLTDGEADLLTPEGGQGDGADRDQTALAMMGELAGLGLTPTAVLTRQTAESGEALGAAAIDPDGNPSRTTPAQPVAEAPAKDAKAAQGQPAWRELPEIPIVEAGCTQRPAADAGGAEYRAQGAFRAAVETARRRLGSPEEPGKETETAGAEAAAQAEFRPQAETSAPGRTERREEAPPLARQLDEGISGQLELGKKEFTLKLKPASLGEITVRLVEKEGRTTLSIVTASSETAKTINSDLAALREAVRPMAVEVREAVPRAPEGSQTQQFGTMGEQLAQQFQQQQRQGFHRPGQTSIPRAETAAEAERLFRAPVLAAGLDTYV